MEKIQTAGRIIFALPLFFFGISHFMNAEMFAERVPFPPEMFWIYFTGIALLAAAISVIIKKYTLYAMIGLAAMLLIFNITMHFPRAGMEAAELATQFNMTVEQAGEFKALNGIVGMLNLVIIGAALFVGGTIGQED